MSSIISRPDHCSFCYVECGAAKLRRCAVCRNVRYCSKECQIKAWKTHKGPCQRAKIDRELREQGLLPEGADTSLGVQSTLHQDMQRWLAIWKPVLYEYGILALNLVNDRKCTSTRNVLLFAERRQDAPTPAQTFRILDGTVTSTDEMVEVMKDIGMAADAIEDFVRDRHNRIPDAIRVIIICGALFRVVLFGTSDADLNEIGPERSRSSAQTWKPALTSLVEKGEPTSKWTITQNTTKSNRF
ncbi:hypothetical protein EWM64_g5951 [Hericium alpestre]|uniref:MYND-type domain-containing protein n=1 Tax=Hericium alpestre TaxID=135208 RepID=A0A4Y9ZVZ0_9AGAM|nr:hypothetical protein EWM64_g5951 [Hericium alpestre]